MKEKKILWVLSKWQNCYFWMNCPFNISSSPYRWTAHLCVFVSCAWESLRTTVTNVWHQKMLSFLLLTHCCVITKRPVQPCTVFHPGMAGVPLSVSNVGCTSYGTWSDSVLHHKLLWHHQYVNLRPKTTTALSPLRLSFVFSRHYFCMSFTISFCIKGSWKWTTRFESVTSELIWRLCCYIDLHHVFHSSVCFDWCPCFSFTHPLKPYFLVCRFSQ